MTELRPSASLAGHLLGGRYRLDRVLASGGMAQVWEATDEVLTRRVAVKILHAHLAADKSFVMRFRREAIAAARLAHPAIVSIFDTVSEDGVEAIVMELVSGVTLKDWLDPRRGDVDPGQAVFIVSQVADALEVAHRAGIVHRDVKPANILVSDDGRVLVTDFGIAKAVAEADITNTGTTLGTARYLAPEQVMGKPVDARADVYSLGVVLYELLCGRCPFNGDSEAAIMMARIHQEPLRPRQVRADVPKQLDEVVMRALHREPSQRYSRASDLRAALLAAYGSQPLDLGASGHAPVDDSRNFSRPAWAGDITGFDGSVVPAGDTGRLVTPSPPPATWVPDEIPRVEPHHRSPRPPDRRWLTAFILFLLVATTLTVAGLLLFGNRGDDNGDRSDDTPPPTSSPPAAGPVLVEGVITLDPFDPSGDGENDEDVGLAVDGNPDTFWETTGYRTRTFGNLKTGLGLVLDIPANTPVGQVTVTSASRHWSFQVFAADAARDDPEAWGAPVGAGIDVVEPVTTVPIGKPAGAVLIWITDLGDAPALVHAQIAEVAILP